MVVALAMVTVVAMVVAAIVVMVVTRVMTAVDAGKGRARRPVRSFVMMGPVPRNPSAPWAAIR